MLERFGEYSSNRSHLDWSLVGWLMVVCPVFLEFSVERLRQQNSQNSKNSLSGSKVRVLAMGGVSNA